MEVVSLDVISIEVIEEAREPSYHELMILPSENELPKEVLIVEFVEAGEDPLLDVKNEGFSVARVELLRVVMGRFLGAHVVDGGVCGVVRGYLSDGRSNQG